MATVFVSGASGFVGKFLILALLRKGDTVFAMLRQPQTQLPLLQQWLQQYGVNTERLSAVRGDFREAGSGISAADWQTMAAVTVIYHTGALFAWGLKEEEARLVNVQGAVALLTAAAQQLSLSRFVQVSGYMLTMTEHLHKLGISGDGSKTDWPAIYQRVGAYEASKLEVHFAIKRAALALKVPLTVIHPATVVGHSESGEIAPNQEFSRTLTDLIKGKLFAVPDGGGYRVPLVTVDYLTEFMAHVADYQETVGNEYLLADDQTPTLKAALTLCAQHAGFSAPRVSVPVPLLQQIVRWQWLGQKLGMTSEQLHFFRTEALDTAATTYMANKMGVPEMALNKALTQTMNYVVAQPR
jgi:thioester reductase-like protein